MDLMRRRTQDALYYAFDLPWLDGQDLRPVPLLDRKAALHQLLKLSKIPAILRADHVEGIGSAFYQVVCARDCEGVVGKRRNGPYGTPMSWFKIINPNYSQHVGRREMFDPFRKPAISAEPQS